MSTMIKRKDLSAKSIKARLFVFILLNFANERFSRFWYE